MSPAAGSPRSVPLACTLDAGDIPGRLAEWQSFFRSSVIRAEERAGSVRLLLDSSETTREAAASLARREKECCAFFDFALTLDEGERWLTVGVPSGAEPTLTTFMAMLRSGTEPLS